MVLIIAEEDKFAIDVLFFCQRAIKNLLRGRINFGALPPDAAYWVQMATQYFNLDQKRLQKQIDFNF